MSRRAAALAAVAVWVIAAFLLWPQGSPVPLPRLDPERFFSAAQLRAAASYARFERIVWVLSTLAQLGALAWYARNGARWLRESAAGHVGTGMLLGMLGFALVWAVRLPFDLAALWWQRRHGLTDVGYLHAVVGDWLKLGGQLVFLCVALAIVMGLASRVGDRWWLPAAPCFAVLGVLFAFLYPWLLDTRPLRDPELRARAAQLERVERVGRTPVVVEPVHKVTRTANAQAVGMGPSRRVVLWDTLLDGRFSDRQVAFVLAHELGHVAHRDIWRGAAWYALLALPGTFVLARVARRRGGMAQPEAVPLTLLALLVLTLLAQPLGNAVSRRIEAAADWAALDATRDPAAARQLLRGFARTSLQQPDPPEWDVVMLQTHPTIMQRLALVEAWLRLRSSRAPLAGR